MGGDGASGGVAGFAPSHAAHTQGRQNLPMSASGEEFGNDPAYSDEPSPESLRRVRSAGVYRPNDRQPGFEASHNVLNRQPSAGDSANDVDGMEHGAGQPCFREGAARRPSAPPAVVATPADARGNGVGTGGVKGVTASHGHYLLLDVPDDNTGAAGGGDGMMSMTGGYAGGQGQQDLGHIAQASPATPSSASSVKGFAHPHNTHDVVAHASGGFFGADPPLLQNNHPGEDELIWKFPTSNSFSMPQSGEANFPPAQASEQVEALPSIAKTTMEDVKWDADLEINLDDVMTDIPWTLDQ